MIAEELVTRLGVELSPGAKEKLQAFDKGLDAVVSRVKQASVVLTAAAGGMALYFSNAVNGAADLQTLSDTMGVSTTKLQEWAYAANAMGVSASAVQSDLAKMEKQARWTGRTLESYANQFKGMDAATDVYKRQVQQHAASFGSVPELVMSFAQLLSAASDIPATRFLGQAPGGLNATGESDLQNYYNMIDAFQRLRIKPVVLKQLSVIGPHLMGFERWRAASKSLDIVFPPLWNESSQVKARCV